jgi:hypothetical protein
MQDRLIQAPAIVEFTCKALKIYGVTLSRKASLEFGVLSLKFRKLRTADFYRGSL